MENISYKNLKRKPLLNLIENYEKMAQEYNGILTIKHIEPIPTIDQYLNSDIALSKEENDEAMFTSERVMAIQILAIIEDLLKEKNVYIPDTDRLGNEEEACIFGTTYYDLEDKIIKIIKENI